MIFASYIILSKLLSSFVLFCLLFPLPAIILYMLTYLLLIFHLLLLVSRFV